MFSNTSSSHVGMSSKIGPLGRPLVPLETHTSKESLCTSGKIQGHQWYAVLTVIPWLSEDTIRVSFHAGMMFLGDTKHEVFCGTSAAITQSILHESIHSLLQWLVNDLSYIRISWELLLGLAWFQIILTPPWGGTMALKVWTGQTRDFSQEKKFLPPSKKLLIHI